MAHMQTAPVESGPPRPPVEVSSEPIVEISATLLRAQAFLSGCGIALMVREGAWLVCRASSGAASPEIGTRIAVENTFLGLCITLKKPHSCEDTDSDPRVESATYSRLRPKSILAVPVRAGQEAIAVLAGFSSAPNAFNHTQVAILRTVADSLSRPVQQLPLSPPADPPASRPESRPAATSSAEPVRESPTKPEPPVVPAAPPPPAPKPREEVLTLADDVAPVPIVREPRPSPPIVREPRLSPPTVRVVTYTVPPTFQVSRPRPRRWGPALLRIAAVTAACLLFALATAGWYSTRVPAAPPRISAVPAEPATIHPTTPAQVPAVPAAVPASSPAAVPATSVATAAAAPPTKPAAAVPSAASPEPSKSSVVEPLAPEPVAPKLPEAAPVTEAPVLALSTPSALPALVGTHSAAPQLHHSVVVPARLESGVAPQYPMAARGRRIAGQVTLSMVIRKDGTVGDAKLLSGNPIFRDAAIDAVKKWRYAPATLDGQPVEATAQVVLKFDPGQKR